MYVDPECDFLSGWPFDFWALTSPHMKLSLTAEQCLTTAGFLIIVLISSNMIQNCFIWFLNSLKGMALKFI